MPKGGRRRGGTTLFRTNSAAPCKGAVCAPMPRCSISHGRRLHCLRCRETHDQHGGVVVRPPTRSSTKHVMTRGPCSTLPHCPRSSACPTSNFQRYPRPNAGRMRDQHTTVCLCMVSMIVPARPPAHNMVATPTTTQRHARIRPATLAPASLWHLLRAFQAHRRSLNLFLLLSATQSRQCRLHLHKLCRHLVPLARLLSPWHSRRRTCYWPLLRHLQSLEPPRILPRVHLP